MSILADLFIFITQSTLAAFTVRVFQKIHLTSLCFLWTSKQWGSNQVSVGSTYFSHSRNRVIKNGWFLNNSVQLPLESNSALVHITKLGSDDRSAPNCVIVLLLLCEPNKQVKIYYFVLLRQFVLPFLLKLIFLELNMIMPDSGSAVCLTVWPVGKHPLVALIFVVLC